MRLGTILSYYLKVSSRILQSPLLKPFPFTFKLFLTRLYSWTRSFARPLSAYIEYSYFPFDSSQPLTPGALETLSDVSKSLHNLNAPCFVSDGTLLGLVRDGRLIPHDNDLDFVVLGIRHQWSVRQIMRQKGFKIASLSRLGSHVYHMSFFNDAQHIVDFTLFEDAGDSYVSFRDYDSYFVIPRDLVMNLTSLEAGQGKVSVPTRSEDFLEYQYGVSWKTPAERKEDWKASFYGTRRNFPHGGKATLSLRREVLSQLSDRLSSCGKNSLWETTKG